MKAMTCRQLGGACEHEFRAASFEEMARLSQQHGMDMMKQQDAPHLQAMQAMRALMDEVEAMQAWMARKRAEFEALPDVGD